MLDQIAKAMRTISQMADHYEELLSKLDDQYHLLAYDDDTPIEDLQANIDDCRATLAQILVEANWPGYG